MAEADRAVREACALCPESAEARLVDGQVAYLKKDYARARTAFSSVAAEAALPAAVRSEAFVGRGIVELAQDACDAARISFLRALRLNPRSAAAWYHLGVLSRDTYRFNEAALEQFEMAARLSDPRDARTKKISHELIPALRKALRALPEKPTVVIVSQRTSSIRHADEILVMDNGRLVGRGTHDELLKTCDVYREIHESQFKKEEA